MRFIPSQFSASFNIANTLRAKLLIKVNKPHMLSLLVHIKVNKLHLFSLFIFIFSFFHFIFAKEGKQSTRHTTIKSTKKREGDGGVGKDSVKSAKYSRPESLFWLAYIRNSRCWMKKWHYHVVKCPIHLFFFSLPFTCFPSTCCMVSLERKPWLPPPTKFDILRQRGWKALVVLLPHQLRKNIITFCPAWCVFFASNCRFSITYFYPVGLPNRNLSALRVFSILAPKVGDRK